MEKLSENIGIDSPVVVSFAGAKQEGTVIKITKDRSKARVKKVTGGLPIWYPAESISLKNGPSKQPKADNVQTQAAEQESTDKAQASQPEQKIGEVQDNDTIVKNDDKDVVIPPIAASKLSKKQSEALEFLRAKITAGTPTLKEKLVLTKVGVLTLMRSLETERLVSAHSDTGELIYTITDKGKTFEYEVEDRKRKPKGKKYKEDIIRLIGEGLKNKEIVAEVGCDPSYVSDMRAYIKIKAAIEKTPEATDEQIAAETGATLWNVKYHRPKIK